MFIPIWLMYYLGNFGGYSIGKNLALYLLAYYVVRVCDNMLGQVIGIMAGSFVLTVLAYHLIKRIPVVRKIIGI